MGYLDDKALMEDLAPIIGFFFKWVFLPFGVLAGIAVIFGAITDAITNGIVSLFGVGPDAALAINNIVGFSLLAVGVGLVIWLVRKFFF